MRLKHTVSKRPTKSRKNRSKSNRKPFLQKRRGGGCSCESTSAISKFFVGGNAGATTNALLALPANNYYPLNNYARDPNYLAVAERQTGNYIHSGGNRKTSRRKGYNKKGWNKVSGGGYLSGSTTTLMPVISATTVGANNYGTALSPPLYSLYSPLSPPPSA